MKENIEEYMEILEKNVKSVKENSDMGFFETDEDYYFFKAVEYILSDYKRVQEEFRQVDHECERLEQKELRLVEEVELAKEALKKQCDIADERNQLLIENQKLQKENEELLEIRISAGAHNRIIELQKENEELKHKYDKALSDVIAGVDLDNTYIPVQKIKDKIEELKKKSGGNVFHIQQTINAEIRLLQELLEEKEEKQ